MTAVLIQLGAALLFVVGLWRAFRFAMALRSARVFREDARQAIVARGGRVVAELPTLSGELALFVEDPQAFAWSDRHVPKSALRGCRLLLNGGVMAASVRDGALLPDPPAPSEYEGREVWCVRLY